MRLIASSAFALEVKRVLWLSSDDVSLRQTIFSATTNRNEESAAVTIEELRVRVVPPAYSGLSTEEVAGDAPVRALIGSQIEVDLTAHGTVEGATLSFNGANVGGQIGVAASGSHVQLTRDVGAVTMDLSGVDALDLTTRGGADTVTFGDLTGTRGRTFRIRERRSGSGTPRSSSMGVWAGPSTTAGADSPPASSSTRSL